MASQSDYTLQEIPSQPVIWASALYMVCRHAADIAALLQRFTGCPLLLCNCGSPYYLSFSAAALMRFSPSIQIYLSRRRRYFTSHHSNSWPTHGRSQRDLIPTSRVIWSHSRAWTLEKKVTPEPG